MVKVCGVVMVMLPGYQLGTGPADRCVVNVGTVRGRPSSGPPGPKRKQARCQLMVSDGAEAS
jgi:hypothetical protein